MALKAKLKKLRLYMFNQHMKQHHIATILDVSQPYVSYVLSELRGKDFTAKEWKVIEKLYEDN